MHLIARHTCDGRILTNPEREPGLGSAALAVRISCRLQAGCGRPAGTQAAQLLTLPPAACSSPAKKLAYRQAADSDCL